MTISELRSPDAAKRINASSTLYVPPASLKEANVDIAKSLNLITEGQTLDNKGKQLLYPPLRWGPLANASTGNAPSIAAYGEAEKAAIAVMATHTQPKDYQPLRASKAIVDAMTTLALDPIALESFLKQPSAYIEAQQGLTTVECAALESKSYFNILTVMKAVPESVRKAVAEGAPNATDLLILIWIFIATDIN